jgi:predicted dehydrogenase
MMKTKRREFIVAASAVAATSLLPKTGFGAEKKKYKACVIGHTGKGDYGHSLHLVWNHRPDVELVALADPNEEGRQKAAAEAGAPKTYADYREMLEKEKPDLVSIGPRYTIRHRDYLLDCVSVGAHGYIEKPISVDLVEADEMVDAVKSKNLKWAIAHQKRMVPQVRFATKAIVEEGLIGDVLEMRSRGKEDHRAGGEDLIVLGTHMFDLMISIYGRPKWCAASILVDGRPATKADVHDPIEAVGPVVGDTIQATFMFQEDLPGHFSTKKNEHGNGGRWGLDIFGTKGIVSMRFEVVPDVLWAETSSWSPATGPIDWKLIPDSPNFQTEEDAAVAMNQFAIDELMAAIEEDREPENSMAQGRDAYEMVQAINGAHIHGGRIDIPLKDRRHPLQTWA